MRLGEWYDSIAHEADIDCKVCGAWYATKYGQCGEWWILNGQWHHWCSGQWHPCKPRVKLTRANGEEIHVAVSSEIAEVDCQTLQKKSSPRKRKRSAS